MNMRALFIFKRKSRRSFGKTACNFDFEDLHEVTAHLQAATAQLQEDRRTPFQPIEYRQDAWIELFVSGDHPNRPNIVITTPPGRTDNNHKLMVRRDVSPTDPIDGDGFFNIEVFDNANFS